MAVWARAMVGRLQTGRHRLSGVGGILLLLGIVGLVAGRKKAQSRPARPAYRPAIPAGPAYPQQPVRAGRLPPQPPVPGSPPYPPQQYPPGQGSLGHPQRPRGPPPVPGYPQQTAGTRAATEGSTTQPRPWRPPCATRERDRAPASDLNPPGGSDRIVRLLRRGRRGMRAPTRQPNRETPDRSVRVDTHPRGWATSATAG